MRKLLLALLALIGFSTGAFAAAAKFNPVTGNFYDLIGSTSPGSSSSSSASTRTIDIPFVSMESNGNLAGCTTCFAPIESTGTGNHIMLMAAYNEPTVIDKCRNGVFTVPPNIATAGNITISITGRSKTAASSKNIAWQLKHKPLANAEAYSTAFLISNSGSVAVSGTQDVMDRVSWTMSISSSTWVASDSVDYVICRTSASVSLVGDYYGRALTVTIPTQ